MVLITGCNSVSLREGYDVEECKDRRVTNKPTTGQPTSQPAWPARHHLRALILSPGSSTELGYINNLKRLPSYSNSIPKAITGWAYEKKTEDQFATTSHSSEKRIMGTFPGVLIESTGD